MKLKGFALSRWLLPDRRLAPPFALGVFSSPGGGKAARPSRFSFLWPIADLI